MSVADNSSFKVIFQDPGKRLMSIHTVIDIGNPEEVKNFIKSVRELAERERKDPVTDVPAIAVSQPISGNGSEKH